MGNPAKPTKLKILQGNPGKRPLNKNEPEPTRGIPSRPEWLSREAKREWSRVTQELDRLGLLTVVDRALISAYCQAWADYVAAQKDIQRNGTYFVTATGYEAPRPSVGIAAKALQQMIQLSARFGFTPSDRSKMSMPEPKETDPFAEFLKNSKAINE